MHEVGVHFEGHAHGAIPHQLRHHGRLVARPVEPAHIVVLGGVVAQAPRLHIARGIGANIREATLLNDAEVLDILPNEIREPTVATLGVLGAGHHLAAGLRRVVWVLLVRMRYSSFQHPHSGKRSSSSHS
uniref:Uncharacterized protein n=1 Tax=Anguilla anguilla TaxID=7936 RepID=A0A0E9X074_ANGAN